MFLDLDKHSRDKLAVIDDSGCELTYADICCLIGEIVNLGLSRRVVFCLCNNSAGSLAGYLALEESGQIPLLLSENSDQSFINNLDTLYEPGLYWLPEDKRNTVKGTSVYAAYGFVLIKTDHKEYPVHDSLSLLMMTSGSTGSPKLVRHKYGNLEANARNVAKAFSWTSDEVGICDLPMNYSMGLNVINSHLIKGATVLLIQKSLMQPEFWEFVKENKGTNFCGVPFSYEIMRRIGFDRMELPDLKTLAQGGGKSTDRMFRWISDYADNNGKRFFATYGTTETSARVSVLEPEMAKKKVGSIGKPIPPNEMELLGERKENDGFTHGELCCTGPNVTMGYAECKEDLSKDDEFRGSYQTGDLAYRDHDGYYYIEGRKGRFLKLFGLRVSLDQAEQIIKEAYPDMDVACAGDDKRLTILITGSDLESEVASYISKKTGIHQSAFYVRYVDNIPRRHGGKVDYSALSI